LTSLVKKLDLIVAESKDPKRVAWVVLLTDDDKAEAKPKELAEKEGIKNVILALESPTGPQNYKIAKEADMTVLLYEKKVVKKNYAFEKGKFSDKDTDAILTALKEIVPTKAKPK
jgi:hypothetical protein